jgi:hypothetical protein
MLKSVAVIVVPNFSVFEFGTAFEVFGIDRGGPWRRSAGFRFPSGCPGAG